MRVEWPLQSACVLRVVCRLCMQLKFEFVARSFVTVLFSVLTEWVFSRYIGLLEDSTERHGTFVGDAPQCPLSDRPVDAVRDAQAHARQAETARFRCFFIVSRRYIRLLESVSDRSDFLGRHARCKAPSNHSVDAVWLCIGKAQEFFVWTSRLHLDTQLHCDGCQPRWANTWCALVLLCCVCSCSS